MFVCACLSVCLSTLSFRSAQSSPALVCASLSSIASHNTSTSHLLTTTTSGGGLVYQLLCVGQSRSVHPAVRWLCIALTGSLVKAERTGAFMRYREEYQSSTDLTISCTVCSAMVSLLFDLTLLPPPTLILS